MPVGHVAHELPERMRIRIPEYRKDDAALARLSQRMEQEEGIASVSRDALTASLLIRHRLDGEDLKTVLTDTLGIDLQPAPVSKIRHGLAPVNAAIETVNQGLRRASSGSTDLQALIFIFLVAAAVRQLLRGQVMVPAISLLWYAFELALRTAPATPRE